MVWFFAALLIGVIAITIFYLRGQDLRSFDNPRPDSLGEPGQASDQHTAVVESMGGLTELTQGVSRRQQLKVMRDYLDSMGADVHFDGEITPVDSDGIKGEWVVAAGADSGRRMLYIHGGAWIMGSPMSHRAITTHYAKLTGGAVFSLDYRLMPENTRQDGIDDCRAAWRWILENGPDGASAPSCTFVSGDSAGGNLTLSLIAWIRDQGLRAPNAAVALSPATDATFSSPSMRANVATDHMLGPQFGKLTRIPSWLLNWGAWASSRIRPSHPSVSPVFDDLSGLPPTLIHASAAEMLLDDAVRYANKARSEGSPVDLQTWENMVHVWHIFVADLPEAQQAFTEIDKFLRANGATEKGVQAA
jgi:monoterpene epsilon-lactone hydrolase